MTLRRRTAVVLLLAAACAAAPETAAGEDPPAGGAPMKEKRRENRLAKEASPYLRQHMHNPVDWMPWGEEAFGRAKKEEKPVFLSIGYSTCHWCHVMERESFEDEDVAKVMNELFVCVKVDREERPDVDSVYMTAVQAMTGQGGWPLSVFLTPDGRPFFGGTYFPPEDRHGRPGFTTVLRRIASVWKDRRGDVLGSAEQITSALREQATAAARGELSADPLDAAADQFRRAFDQVHGGFGPAPKFPRAFVLSFLLRRSRTARGKDLVALVEKSLDGMRRGGIHDALGGGFHRYSTDREWLLPHFEKMLYDQAAALNALTDAWLVTRNPLWEKTARDTVGYVLRDLRDPAGGFHSAEDADSEGVEGKFYVWTKAELASLLGEEDAALFARVYAATDEGNFIDEAHRTRTGANILHLASPLEHHAKMLGTDPVKLEERLAPMRAKLLAARSKRVRPHLDDKVLADWNGMAIGALARAGAAFGEESWVREAARAADFVLVSMRREGRLLHRWRGGDLAIPAFLDDHAYLALGLADLYEATFDAKWLAASRDLLRTMVAEFRDEDGAFRLVSARGEALLVPTRELYDGALPSGNSVAALALLRVGRATGDEELESAGRKCLEAWAAHLTAQPSAFPVALQALEFVLGPTREVVIAGDPADAATRALVAEVRKRFLPDTVVLLHPPGAAGAAIEAVSPFVKAQGPVGGKAAAYVCADRTCAAPVTTPAELAALLDQRPAPR